MKVSFAILAFVFALGLLTFQTEGFPARFKNLKTIRFTDPYAKLSKSTKGFECPEIFRGRPIEFCRQKKGMLPKVAIWGDSLSIALQKGFEDLEFPSLLIEQGGCPPLADYQVTLKDKPPLCKTSNNEIIKSLSRLENIKTVILVSLGRPYIEKIRRGLPWEISIDYQNQTSPDFAKSYEEALTTTARELTDAGKKVIFYDPQPELSTAVVNPKDCENTRPFRFAHVPRPDCKRSEAEFLKSRQAYRDLVAKVQQKVPSLVIFNAAKYFCSTGVCNAIVDDYALYLDPEHLTVDGGRFISAKLLPLNGTLSKRF